MLDSDELLVFGAETFGERFVEEGTSLLGALACWSSVPEVALPQAVGACAPSLSMTTFGSYAILAHGVLADVDEMTTDPSVLLKGLPVSQLQAVGEGEIAALATDFLLKASAETPVN